MSLIFKKIHWDLDGTLCTNTENIAFQGIRDAFVQKEPKFDETLPDAQTLTSFAGFSTREVVGMILDEPYAAGVLVNDEAETKVSFEQDVMGLVNDCQLSALKVGATALDGLDSLLDETDSMIVSTSALPRILASLEGCEKNGLRHHFDADHVMSADDSVRAELGIAEAIGKPNPTVYLLAAYKDCFQDFRNNARPADTIYQIYRIEDSASGGKAALRAAGRHDGERLLDEKMSGAALLDQPAVSVFKSYLEERGHAEAFAAFLDNNVESLTVGVDSCTHIKSGDKPAHRAKLQALGVDHLASSVGEIRAIIQAPKKQR